MRLLEVDLDVQTSLCFLEQLLDTRGSRLAVEVSETNAFGMLGDVLAAEEVGLEAGGAEDRGGVRHARIQLPIETVVGEPHDAVVVGVETGSEAGPAGAALWRGREGHVEPDARPGERVQVRAHDALHAVAVEMAADIVRGHHDHVECLGRYAVSP